MTTQTIKPSAIFPDLPRSEPAVEEDGNFSPVWSLAVSQLFQALQINFSNEGLRFPPLTSTEMATIAGMYTPYINKPLPQNDPTNKTQNTLPDISGATVFDSTNRNPNQFVIAYDTSTPPNISLAQWMRLSLITFFPGDPNTHLAGVGGVLGWFCINTATSELYVCTTAGSATGTPAPQAVWTGIVSDGSFLLL